MNWRRSSIDRSLPAFLISAARGVASTSWCSSGPPPHSPASVNCAHTWHTGGGGGRGGGAQMVTVDLQARCSNNLLRNFDRKLNLPEFDCTQQPRETLAAQFHGGRAPGVAGWRTSLMACSTVASSVIGAGGGRGPRGHTPYGSPAPRLGDRTPRWPRAATPGHAPPPLLSCGAS